MAIHICQDCGANWSVSDAEHAESVSHNEITQKLVQGRMTGWDGKDAPTSYMANIGICPACQRIHRAASKTRRSRPPVEHEMAAIRNLMSEIHEIHSELTIEQVAHLAVEEWNSPNNEPNARFAAYLRDMEEII